MSIYMVILLVDNNYEKLDLYEMKTANLVLLRAQ
ncbi:hypothetical protein T12_12697 [Trichinella patagoniensis]|uniref:Uncharacterized protein n=1 Tax=Trichinella patagoniensis TaxID=990121 RepID=A0A0V0YTU3_9BILA|nr:hypothetical protein T12_431 [Trichinella patagoniensis]KRY03698.1 hypothetical protein T12_12697 [Trichinella patagoniensis]